MSSDIDPMAEIRALFFVECEELLEALQDGLQQIDDGVSDGETINVVFRAVHSIKGGAGAFGLNALVRFTHSFESALEEVRSGRMTIDAATLKLFFQSTDHLADLVRASSDQEEIPSGLTAQLVANLQALLRDSALISSESEQEIEFQPMSICLDLGSDDAESLELPALELVEPPKLSSNMKQYVVTFTPSAELFDTGNEPFLLLRNLADLGHAQINVDTNKIPDLHQLDAEIPHLTWTVFLECEADTAEITSVFEFVEGMCVLEIEVETAASSSGNAPSSPAPSKPNLVVDQSQGSLAKDLLSVGKPETDATSVDTAKAPSVAKAATSNAPAKPVVRVDLDRIERLVNLVGELVINQAMLSQSFEQAGLSPHSDAMNGLEEFQRLTRDIQDSVMMIRAQPVKSLFQRMSRIVREASIDVEKDVRLQTEGDGTEVDKTVIERLADPLTHMIRNAVDHGLETTQERIAAGKPAQGRVRLSAAHRSGRVIIEVADDGAGINRPKVLEMAMDKGLVPVDAQLSDTEIDNLLFLPGFSTSSVVSDLSGRGVGMDVVRTAIQALGGRITTTSVPGSGTTFSISLPLTLAVLDGMIVEVAGETLVLPLTMVVETMTLTEADVETISPGKKVVRVRHAFLPLFDLGVELGYRNPLERFEDAIVLVITHEDGGRAALVIDNILDQRQVVIKGLDDSFYRAPGIAAATILGDGQIALILDPSDIITNSIQHPAVHIMAQNTGALA